MSLKNQLEHADSPIRQFLAEHEGEFAFDKVRWKTAHAGRTPVLPPAPPDGGAPPAAVLGHAIGARIGVSVLCPGPVSTRIMESERNRPGRLENDAAAEVAGHRPEGTAYADALTNLVVSGPPPSDMADAVFQAILDRQFYVLPHPAYDDVIRARFDSILGRANPPSRG